MVKGWETHPNEKKNTTKKRIILIDGLEQEKPYLKEVEKNRVGKHTILIYG